MDHGVTESWTRLSDFHFREDGHVQVCNALHSTHHTAALPARQSFFLKIFFFFDVNRF